MYRIIKKLFFLLGPEQSHYLALNSLKIANHLGLTSSLKATSLQHLQLMGLSFPHPVGLAAGLDKNADYVDALAALGFGFIEVGTVTPKPQTGNPKPRLFRLVRDEAIINRMGFNNKGVEYLCKRLSKVKYKGILGINIGKNRNTPNEKAVDDYLYCFKKLWPFASYITINISSPNTKGLRDLQAPETLAGLLSALKAEQSFVLQTQQKYVPLLVKIAPDLTVTEINELADVLIQQKLDGLIASNTTLSRDRVSDLQLAKEMGGLSGKPLGPLSTEVIRKLRHRLPKPFPIIASGGIMDTPSANEKLLAGADLLQIYTGFIYHGPGLIKQLAKVKLSS